MIHDKDCMNLVLTKFPNFNSAWKVHLEWWDDEDPGLCNNMSAFSHYVIDLLKNKNSDNDQEIKDIFIFIEELVEEGDKKVSEAACTCFLENLINATSWKRIPASRFINLLGPLSKDYCKAWDEFTNVKTEGLWPNDENQGGNAVASGSSLDVASLHQGYYRLLKLKQKTHLND